MPGTPPDPNRRFLIALERSLANWAAADPITSATLAGCALSSSGITVPFFNRRYHVSHPAGEVMQAEDPERSEGGAGSRPKKAHPSIAIVVLHYLMSADGTRPAERWATFREMPNGLFYAQAFAGHAEAMLAEKYGSDLAAFRKAALALGGAPLELADAGFRFQALPRLPLAAVLAEGDEDFPAQARIFFDAAAGHYLPTEDLAGLGEWLAHHLVA